MTVTKMYFSREDRVRKHIHPIPLDADLDEAYDEANKAFYEVETAIDNLNEAYDAYFDSLYDYRDENSDETEAGVHMMANKLSDAWGVVQKRISEFAILMGIDGNKAYEEILED